MVEPLCTDSGDMLHPVVGIKAEILLGLGVVSDMDGWDFIRVDFETLNMKCSVERGGDNEGYEL